MVTHTCGGFRSLDESTPTNGSDSREAICIYLNMPRPFPTALWTKLVDKAALSVIQPHEATLG
jgi:hypothetical protein